MKFRLLFHSALLLATLLPGSMTAAAPVQPNLLFVFTDQHSFDMVGCYGNKQIKTPNIDRLAKEGVRFEYCISSTPVCCPMRAMLVSGRHPLDNGVLVNDLALRPAAGQAFAEVLHDHGYRCGYIGKWHLYGGDRNRPVPAGPARFGFDDTFLTDNCSFAFDTATSFYFDQDTGKKVKLNDWQVFGQTEQARKFIATAETNRPWALFVSWHPPHDRGEGNYPPAPGQTNLYDPAKIELRASMTNTPEVRKRFAGYMSMITGCDEAFGRLLETLEKSGQKDRTIVVFTSDHGDLHGAHGRPWPKGFPEDEASRVPLIVRYPGVLKPRTSELLVGTLDLMPTLLGMMKLPVPATCAGQNLAPHILAKKEDAVESVPFFYFAPSWRGVFTKRYTYSERAKNAPEGKLNYNTLYDRKRDPHQLQNHFADADYAKTKARLQQQMHVWLERFQDPFLPETEMYRLFNWMTQLLDKAGETGQLPASPREIFKAAAASK